jgi:hypothetical protein
MITDNFVIFRNYSIRGYWELSGLRYTTYLSHSVILGERGKEAVELMMYIHGIKNIESVYDTLVKYSKDPQEDMFIVEI